MQASRPVPMRSTATQTEGSFMAGASALAAAPTWQLQDVQKAASVDVDMEPEAGPRDDDDATSACSTVPDQSMTSPCGKDGVIALLHPSCACLSNAAGLSLSLEVLA